MKEGPNAKMRKWFEANFKLKNIVMMDNCFVETFDKLGDPGDYGYAIAYAIKSVKVDPFERVRGPIDIQKYREWVGDMKKSIRRNGWVLHWDAIKAEELIAEVERLRSNNKETRDGPVVYKGENCSIKCRDFAYVDEGVKCRQYNKMLCRSTVKTIARCSECLAEW